MKNSNLHNEKVTFLNTIKENSEPKFLNPKFEDMLKLMTMQDDANFLRHLKKIGYEDKLYDSFFLLQSYIKHQNWDGLLKNKYLIVFLLKDIWISDNEINIINLFKTQESIIYTLPERLFDSPYVNRIEYSDFITATDSAIYGLDVIPYEIANQIRRELKKGIYSLKKPFLPIYSFARYKKGIYGRSKGNMEHHSGYVGLDFDKEFHDEEYVIQQLNTAFDIVAITRSPSGILRPFVRIDLSDNNLKFFAKTYMKNHSSFSNIQRDFLLVKYVLIYKYHRIAFEKIKDICNQLNLGVPLDYSTSTATRVWYFGRDTRGLVQEFNPDVNLFSLTAGEIMKYGALVD